VNHTLRTLRLETWPRPWLVGEFTWTGGCLRSLHREETRLILPSRVPDCQSMGSLMRERASHRLNSQYPLNSEGPPPLGLVIVVHPHPLHEEKPSPACPWQYGYMEYMEYMEHMEHMAEFLNHNCSVLPSSGLSCPDVTVLYERSVL
jgi:hypothetical protein